MGVYTRPQTTQGLHDTVIQTAAQRLDRSKYDVHMNPGSEKNIAVGSEYPDIVVTPRGANTVQFIIEVETEDSVSDSEADAQWKPYSELGGAFYLLVPHSSLQAARSICLRKAIRAKFATYWFEHNQLQITYY